MDNPYVTITGATKRTHAQGKVLAICEDVENMIKQVQDSDEIDYRDKQWLLMNSTQMIDWCIDTRGRLEQVYIGDEE